MNNANPKIPKAKSGRFTWTAFFCLTTLLATFDPNLAHAQFVPAGPAPLSRGVAGSVSNGASVRPSVAPNGQFAAFASSASNLVPMDTNGVSDIFVADTDQRNLTRVSVNNQGQQGDAASTEPSISPIAPDGFYAVTFVSSSTNFGRAPMPNAPQNIIFRAPTLSLSAIVTFGTGPTAANGDSESPSTTIIPAPNRILVAYASNASNLVTNDANSFKDVFFASIRRPEKAAGEEFPDLVSTTLVSINSLGEAADGESSTPKISGDGKMIVFSSVASNLLAGREISGTQIYLYNIQKRSLSIVSQDSGGNEANGTCTSPSISFNGRYVLYNTTATNIVSNPEMDGVALVLYDTFTGVSQRVNSAVGGEPGDGVPDGASVSPDGRFVGFSDTSTNLIPNDTNAVEDIFIKDLESGAVERISVGPNGQGNATSDSPSFGGASFNSSTGLFTFRSFSTNLGDPNLPPPSGLGDIFLVRIGLPKPPLTRDTRLEVPADVSVSKRKAIVSTLEFGEVDLSAEGSQVETSATTVKYDVRVNGTGSIKNERYRKVSKRNTTTFRNLPSGTYKSRYRVVSSTGGGTTSRSSYSPIQRFKISR